MTGAGNDVAPEDRCPKCGERDADRLAWEDEQSVRCQTCGGLYRPLDSQN